MELLIVIGIIMSLVGIFLPTIYKARESAVRIQCANNLRQIGLAETMYANTNGGWLWMRAATHAGSTQYLSPVNGGYFSENVLLKAGPMRMWFCPEYRSTLIDPSQPVPEWWQKHMISSHQIGYSVYGAAWVGGVAVPTAPSVGVPCFNYGATKAKDLKPGLIRMGEWYTAIPNQNDCPAPFHWHKKRQRDSFGNAVAVPEGGNLLYGDCSVQWTTSVHVWYGHEVFAVPAAYAAWR